MCDEVIWVQAEGSGSLTCGLLGTEVSGKPLKPSCVWIGSRSSAADTHSIYCFDLISIKPVLFCGYSRSTWPVSTKNILKIFFLSFLIQCKLSVRHSFILHPSALVLWFLGVLPFFVLCFWTNNRWVLHWHIVMQRQNQPSIRRDIFSFKSYIVDS